MSTAPQPYGPVPSERQLNLHRLETYGFVHFSPNTFTGSEWGYGDENPKIFNPTAFDADQIAETAREGGLKGLILTCKHHDGFCLWPSRYTEHCVRNSSWRNGQGDVVRELSDACERQGIRFGVYLSPWDRNHPDYAYPGYIDYYHKQLRELLTEYGPIFEIWFDGANGGDGYYGGACETRAIDKHSYYGWDEIWGTIRELQPDACIFSDAGPDLRWVGNEKGIAADPCWNTYDRHLVVPGERNGVDLTSGRRDAPEWVPAECDVSIRPGWFYHPEEDTEVRSPENLLDLFFNSVGRGATLNLNLPPDRRGVIHEHDRVCLHAFRRRLNNMFQSNVAERATLTPSHTRGDDERFSVSNLIEGDLDTYWSCEDDVHTPTITLEFPEAVTVDILELREYLPLGQRVDDFRLQVLSEDGEWSTVLSASAIGNRRLVPFFPASSTQFRLCITKGGACPALSRLGLYNSAQA